MLDLSHLPRIPLKFNAVYLRFQTEAVALKKCVQSLSVDEARGNTHLAEQLIEFSRAMEELQKTLPKNEAPIAQSIHELRDSDTTSFWAASLLMHGRVVLRPQFVKGKPHIRIRLMLKQFVTEMERFGSKETIWRHTKRFLVGYIDAILARLNPQGQMLDERPFDGTKPEWDDETRTLRINEKIIKTYQRPAEEQIKILNGFQEQNWRCPLEDPLDPEKLRHTLRNMKRTFEGTPLRFHGDGTGRGINWSLLNDFDSSSTPD